MANARTARQLLREATSVDHDTVDRAFGSYDLSDAGDYADFLMAQAAAFLPVEDAIDRSAPHRVVADWDDRRRSRYLRSDLSLLGRDVPASGPLPPFDTPAAALGAIYVLEGSRLGGQMLARGVYPGAPMSFLSANNPALWRSLLITLEKELVTPQQHASAIAAARGVFALFERGARVVATAR